jgi:hypothetical protein
MGHGVVVGGVERLAFGVDALEALLGKYFEKRARHLLYVFPAAVREGQVGRIEHRQEFFHQRGGRVFEDLALLALYALAVVVELSLQAEQSVEVLIALAPGVPRTSCIGWPGAY